MNFNNILKWIILSIFLIIYVFIHLNYWIKFVPWILPYGLTETIILIITYCAFFTILGWLVVSLSLLRSERKIFHSSVTNVFFWFSPRLLKLRYRGRPLINTILSIIIISFLFTITIPSMVAILNGVGIENKSKSNTSLVQSVSTPNIIDTTAVNNKLDKDIVFGEGIIFVFIISIIGVWTFINTEYLKARGEIEITDLNDLFSHLIRNLKEMIKKKSGNLYYYILDYSIATGHYSQPTGFDEYRKVLRTFMCKHKVKFLGIVYEKNILNTNYSKIQTDPAECKKLCINSRDSLINYLNKKDEGDDIEYREVVDEYKINYLPIRENDVDVDPKYTPTHLEVERHNHWLKWDKNITLTTQQYNAVKNQLKTKLITQNGKFEDINSSIVVETKEIGLTRLIISNTFVIQFVARAENHSNRPIGYYSEDRYMIEKFKTVFEDYFKGTLT